MNPDVTPAFALPDPLTIRVLLYVIPHRIPPPRYGHLHACGA